MKGIVEQFGKRGRQEPTITPAPRPIPPPAPHEQAAKALQFVSSLHDEVAYLRDEANRLRADLNLQLMRTRDLEHLNETMRVSIEAYRNYAVEVKTHLRHIVDVAIAANDAALAAGERPAEPDKQAEEVIARVERELRETVEVAHGAGEASNG